MQLRGGQVNPGLSFFRAIQDLVQRPASPGRAGKAAGPAAVPGRRGGALLPGELPSAEAMEHVRRTIGGGHFIPRGSFLNILV